MFHVVQAGGAIMEQQPDGRVWCMLERSSIPVPVENGTRGRCFAPAATSTEWENVLCARLAAEIPCLILL
jgi:hypothetical protein